MIKNSRLKTAAEIFNADFQYAKMQSVKQAVPVFLVSTGTGATWCYGISNTAACNCTVTDTTNAAACTIWEDVDKDLVQDANENMLKVTTSASFNNIELESQSFGATGITFSPINATAENGNFTFTNNAGSLRVVTTLLGRSRYCTVDYAWGGYDQCE